MGGAYDTWTADGVLERYWGEHIHHGFYPEGRINGVDFRAAKRALVERLLSWADPGPVQSVLDVGCGIGGSSRLLHERLDAEVVGVTLSAAQVGRARQLTDAAAPIRFEQADALHLPFPDDRFDLVWSCESGEHMPDKRTFFAELVRVLKPGGTLILATWCVRPGELSHRERARLDAIYRDWTLPFFIPVEEYAQMALLDGRLRAVRTDDWSRQTSPTWRHQLVLGARDVFWLLRQGPGVIGRSLRDARTALAMIRGFAEGTVRYGLLRGTKEPPR